MKQAAVYLFLPLALLLHAVALLRADVPQSPWKNGDELTEQKLNDLHDGLRMQLAGLAPCPVGYTHDVAETGFTLCKRGVDQVVKVGDGTAAFWIDRYEATVWPDMIPTEPNFGVGIDDYPASFPENGQVLKGNFLFALSVVNKSPSSYLTWYQAMAACAASGKTLPSRQQWLLAAQGTPDVSPDCHTFSIGARQTGKGSACRSNWGAEDMIGNLWEWTDEWYAGLYSTSENPTPIVLPDGYNGDATFNISSSAFDVAFGVKRVGLPGAAIRGGSFFNQTTGGVFALGLRDSPSASSDLTGFRCVIPR